MASERDARTKILAAAEDRFAERGYTGATIRDIAACAGVNLAMIHYYFGSKEGLYRELFEVEVARVREIIGEAIAVAGSSSDRLAHFVRAYASFLCSHPNFARIAQQEMLTGGAMFHEVFKPQVRANYAQLRGIIEAGVRSGEFRHVDIDLTPFSLIGMVVFFLIAQPVISGLLGTSLQREEFAERLAAHTISLFLNGVSHD